MHAITVDPPVAESPPVPVFPPVEEVDPPMAALPPVNTSPLPLPKPPVPNEDEPPVLATRFGRQYPLWHDRFGQQVADVAQATF